MIRIACEADVPEMLAIYGPYVLNTTHTFEYDVPSGADFLARFRQITAQFPWLVWEEGGSILGYAYGSAPFERAAYRWSSETSVYLRPEARGRGIGRKLYTALEKLLALQGYRRNYAIITSENTASLDFHKALGYRLTARMPGCAYKFGRELGIVWMEKTLNIDGIPTNFPTPWPHTRQVAENRDNILDILSLS